MTRGPALGPSNPVTVDESRSGNDLLALGPAIDGVTVVSFMAGGHEDPEDATQRPGAAGGQGAVLRGAGAGGSIHMDRGSEEQTRASGEVGLPVHVRDGDSTSRLFRQPTTETSRSFSGFARE